MRHYLTYLGTNLLLLVLLAPSVRAQNSDQEEDSRIGPVQPTTTEQPTNSPTDGGGASIPAVLSADSENFTLTGAKLPRLGETPERHSSLRPQFDYFSQFDTNGLNAPGSGTKNVTSMNSMLAGVTLQAVGTHSELSLSYEGGRSFSNDQDVFNSSSHLFGLTESWSRARWSGTLADQFNYQSESTFQGGLPFDVGGFGVDLSNLRPAFVPGQNIVTSRGPRYGNSAVVETDYLLSHRASLSFVGSYGLLRFVNPGFIDGNNAGGQVGYNYQLSRRDTLGVIYRYNRLWFNGVDQIINDHSAQLAIGHRIGEQIVLQVAAGPDVSLLKSGSAVSTNRLSWSMNSFLAYQLQRTSFGISYDHMLTGGSGAFVGASTDQVGFSATRQFSRAWFGSSSVGFGRNSPLSFSTGGTSTRAFNTVFAGVRVNRTLGRSSSIFLGYTARYQDSSLGTCTGTGCGENVVGHQVAFGFSWHPGAIPIH